MNEIAPPNFLPPTPEKDFANKWRNTAVLGVLFVFLLGAGVLEFVPRSYAWRHAQASEPVNENNQIGGDIVQELPPAPVPPSLVPGELLPDPGTFTAQSILATDVETGAALYKKNESYAWPVASITKLMSALIILEKEPVWAPSTVVVPDDLIDTHMYAGDTYTLLELWQAALIGSSNKAILTLADAVGWPREAFVERMNQKAVELGMAQTHFVDPTGLAEGNISTVSDIVFLLQEAIKHEEIRAALTTKELNLYSQERDNRHHLWNTNWLLLGWIPNELIDFRGGKTGYIPASGYNFVMQVANAEGHIINVAVFGAESHEARFTEARDVAQWVFAHYTWPSASADI